MSPPWLARLQKEHDDLADNISKLQNVLEKDTIPVDEAEKERLTRQLDYMTEYKIVLAERLLANEHLKILR